MSNLYDEFEKKFQFSWFSAGWVEAELKQAAEEDIQEGVRPMLRKDLSTLEQELEALKEDMETINQKQLQLSNLAKFYNT